MRSDNPTSANAKMRSLTIYQSGKFRSDTLVLANSKMRALNTKLTGSKLSADTLVLNQSPKMGALNAGLASQKNGPAKHKISGLFLSR